MIFNDEQLNEAHKSAVKKAQHSWSDRFLCKHKYKQTHPKPVPDDWPKDMPIPLHNRRYRQGSIHELATFTCVSCGKEKSIRLESLRYLQPVKPKVVPPKGSNDS